jgi:hypothetical protein
MQDIGQLTYLTSRPAAWMTDTPGLVMETPGAE